MKLPRNTSSSVAGTPPRVKTLTELVLNLCRGAEYWHINDHDVDWARKTWKAKIDYLFWTTGWLLYCRDHSFPHCKTDTMQSWFIWVLTCWKKVLSCSLRLPSEGSFVFCKAAVSVFSLLSSLLMMSVFLILLTWWILSGNQDT